MGVVATAEVQMGVVSGFDLWIRHCSSEWVTLCMEVYYKACDQVASLGHFCMLSIMACIMQVGKISGFVGSFGTCEFFKKLCERGQLHDAVKAIDLMYLQGIHVSTTIFYCLLQGCINKKDLQAGREAYSRITRSGFDTNAFLASHLIRMFASCEDLPAARQTFSRLPEPTTFTWSAIILAHANVGQAEHAIQLYCEMQQSSVKPNEYIFVAVLKACCSRMALSEGRLIHAEIVERGLETDVFVGSILINMYMKCDILKDAQRVFEKMRKKNVVTWNALIAGYVYQGDGQVALQLFHEMQQHGIWPDTVSFISMLKACSTTQALQQGKMIHAGIIENGLGSDGFVCSALIDMYAKCESLEDARRLFDKLPNRDVVACNAMIAGYAQNGHGHNALGIFQKMLQKGIKPTIISFVSSLNACSSILALDEGRLIHSFFIESGFDLGLFTGNTLIDMYAKCGSLEDAGIVFGKMIKQDIITWTAMIAGHAQHNNYLAALQYFEEMQLKGFKPVDITYLCLLSACCRAGLLKEGIHHFRSMKEDHGVTPKTEHYYCMVDLFGRAGHLEDAERLLERIPHFGIHFVGWKILLSHCRTHGDVQLGMRCFENVVPIDCRDSSGYVVLSNIYADAGMYETAMELEEWRKCSDAWKKPGKAAIEVSNVVYNFIVGDKCHPQSHDIYAKWKQLSVSIKVGGYVPTLHAILHLVPDLDNEEDSFEHCGDYAIDCG